METNPNQPKDELLRQIRQECNEAGQTILQEYLGTVREIDNEDIFCIFYEIDSQGCQTSDELCATFKKPDFLAAANNEESSPGKIFYLMVVKSDNDRSELKVIYRQPREFTPEERELIRIRAAEYMEVLGEPPTKPIL